MKRTLFALLLAVAAVPAFAAIEYEYVLKSSTDDAVAPSSDLTARAVLDGTRSRVDFVAGNTYPPGTFVISADGSRLYFVDPTKKWYTEFNAAGAVSAIGATNIKLENVKTNMQKLADRPVIAGLETEHYQVTMNYDVIVTMRAIPLKQSVQTVIDTWVTTKYGNFAQHALALGFRTGNPQVDELLDVESTRIPGFVMKQTTIIRTKAHNRAANSQLNPTRTISREMRVMSIGEVSPTAGMFTIPTGYVRAATTDTPKTAMETLTFQPATPK